MKVTKNVSYTYTFELTSYDAVQLADVLLRAIERHEQHYNNFLTPQEIVVARELKNLLGEQINLTVV